jgi:hypothetical protein
MLAVTALTIGAAVVCGLALALLGRLKLALARRHLGALGPGAEPVPSLRGLNLALPPVVLLAGLLVDLAGARLAVVVGSVALALALLGLGGTPTYRRAVVGVLTAAFAAAALGTASIVLMPRAFFGADQTAASLQVGTVFFALGALLAATLADLVFRALPQGRALALLAFLGLLPAFLVPLAEDRHFPSGPGGGVAALLADPDLWLGGLVLFFYAPLEAAVTAWAAAPRPRPAPAEEENGPPPAWLLPGFWATFLASRLVVGLAGHAGFLSDAAAPWVLVGAALLAAVVLGNLAGAPPGGRALWVLGLGFVLGPIFPSLLAMVFLMPGMQRAPAPGVAAAILFAAGSAGSALLAALVPVPAAPATLRPAAFRVPLLFALLLTVAALTFGLLVA